MPLKIAHRKEADVPSASSAVGNDELVQLKSEMSKLAAGMVLEIEAGSDASVRRTKNLVTRAGKQLGRPFVHWHQGSRVFAKPAEARRPGRPRKMHD
jgi:hypothetical protein